MNKSYMWLCYGVDKNNKLVAILDVSSGKVDLICPYSVSILIAKKAELSSNKMLWLGKLLILQIFQLNLKWQTLTQSLCLN